MTWMWNGRRKDLAVTFGVGALGVVVLVMFVFGLVVTS